MNPSEIKQEFLKESGIARDIFNHGIEILPDLEIDPVTHEVEGTPLYDALGWDYKRFRPQANPNLTGAGFKQESGEIWQIKVFGKRSGEKTGQYYAPKGIGDVPYLPPVPQKTWEAIANYYNLPMPPENTSFWEWFKLNKVIDLTLTEGGKKSLSAFSENIPAIALYGCQCGVDKETGEIKEALRPYVEGRQVYIAFDQDSSRQTRRKVNYAIKKLAKGITKAGSHPYQVTWNASDGKGLDDVIKNRGGEYFKQRINLADFVGNKQTQLNTIKRDINLRVTQPTLKGLIDQLPRKGKILINSPKCTRKSSAIIEPLVQEWRKEKKLIISLVPRILLGKEQVEKWDIIWIDDYGKKSYESYDSIDLCFDSLGKIATKDWSGALVIFDEIRQGLKHLISSSTLDDRRPYVLKLLEDKLPEAIRGGGVIVGCDADLTDVEINYLDKICPGNTFIVKNDFVPEKGLVNFNTGKYDETLDEIIERYKNGENLFIFCDSKANSIAIHQQLKQLDSQGNHWLINGDTTQEKEIKEIINNNINKSILEQQPRSLVFTTSMSTGISIDGLINSETNKNQKDFYKDVYTHFTYGFVIAEGGILEPVEVTQAMGRNRNNIPFTVYSGKGKIRDDLDKSCDPEVIKRQIFKRNHKAFNILEITSYILEEKLGREPTHLEVLTEVQKKCDPEIGMIIDPHLDLYCQVQARANYGSQNFDLMLYQQLKDEGFKLIRYDCMEITSIGNSHRELKKEQGLSEARAIADADDITIEEATEISYKNATLEERRQATKAFLKAELPGIEISPQFVHKAIIKDKRRWLKRHQLFWYCHHPKVTKEIDRGRYVNKIRQFSNGVIFLPDIRNYSVMVDEIHQLGLFDLIDFHKPLEVSKDDPRVVEFMQKAYFRRHKIYTALGLTVTKKTDSIKLIERLLQRVGLGLICSRTEKQGEKKIRYYSLDTEAFNDPDRLAVLEALDRRFLGERTMPLESPETPPPQAIEEGTGLADELYINESPVSEVLVKQTLLDEPDQEMFWWGKCQERYDQDFEFNAHLAYWLFLSVTDAQSVREVKEKIKEISVSLGYPPDYLAKWVFNRMPDEEQEFVDGLPGKVWQTK